MTPMQILINVDVDDLDKATHFYQSAFGLNVGRRFGTDGVEMLGSSAPIYLLAKAAGTAASGSTPVRRSYARHWTPVHFDFVVEDIESAIRQAVAAGAQLERSLNSQMGSAGIDGRSVRPRILFRSIPRAWIRRNYRLATVQIALLRWFRTERTCQASRSTPMLFIGPSLQSRWPVSDCLPGQ